jgi:hypothetical protein
VGPAVLALAASFDYWSVFVAGPARADSALTSGTVETRLGLWLAEHPESRPVYVHGRVLDALSARRAEAWYPWINCCHWYGPEDSISAIQLAAGLYRESPARARAPLAANGDIDLVAALPDRLDRAATFVVPAHLAAALKQRFPIVEETRLGDAQGRPLALILRAEPDAAR